VELAQGSLAGKKAALAEALTGQFEDHHARLLRVLLGTVDHLTAHINELDRLIAQAPGRGHHPTRRLRGTGTEPAADAVTAQVLAERLDAVPGIGPATRADRPRRDRHGHEPLSPRHLVSGAKLCPRTIQSGAKNSAGPAGQGNPWLKGALGEAANAAARTDTFLGADWHQRHLNPVRRTRDLVRQLRVLGHQVTLEPATIRPTAPRSSGPQAARMLPPALPKVDFPFSIAHRGHAARVTSAW
jgi:hypothetical protein